MNSGKHSSSLIALGASLAVLVVLGVFASCGDQAGAPDEASATSALRGPSSVAPYECVDEVGAGEREYRCGVPCDDDSCPPFLPCVHNFCWETDFHVSISKECAEGGCGLILDVHGGRMNGKAQNAISDMRAVGAERGFVVVQPSAAYRCTDEGLPCENPDGRIWLWGIWEPPGSPSIDLGTLEVESVHNFVEDVIRAYAVDEEAVHITGFSQGGWMTWQQLCHYPDTYASGAPVSWGQSAGYPSRNYLSPSPHCFEEDGPALEMPILWVHGTKDAVVDYDTYAEPLLEHIIDVWALELEEQECYGGDNEDEGDDGDVDTQECLRGTVSSFESAEGTDFVHIAHSLHKDSGNNGHCYPGVGGTPDVFDSDSYWAWRQGCGVEAPEDRGLEPIGETIVNFFEDHHRDEDDQGEDED